MPIYSPSPIFEFGGFVFDPLTGDLRQHGARIRIDRQTATLLHLLVLQPGNLITREQIREALWPQHDVLNHDKVINNGISRLRYIFGDDPRVPTFIERIPKLGYRFLVEVQRVAPMAVVPQLSAETAVEVLSAPQVSLILAPDHAAALVPYAAADSTSGLATAASAPQPGQGRWWLIAGILISVAIAAVVIARQQPLSLKPAVAIVQPISLGIAPFETNSTEAEQIARSFRLDLTDSLSQLPQVRMRAAHSMDHLKLDSADLPTQAQELGLDAILFGHFTLEGTTYHLQLEIVRGKDATHLATMQYSGSIDELVSLRDKVQQNIFFQLRLTSTGVRPGGNTTDPKAYEAYLSGRYHFTQQTDEALRLAVANFKNAVQLDPHFAKAYAALGRNYVVMGIHNTIPREESIASATLALDEALRIAPDLADAHATRGLLLFYALWDFPAAEREIREAIGMDPNQPGYHQALARVLAQTGRFDEALRQIDLARDEDRGSIQVLSAESFLAVSALRCDRMLAASRRLSALMHDAPSALDYLANGLWTCGRQEEAIKQWYAMAEKERDTGRMDMEARGLKAFQSGGVRAYASLRLDAIHAARETLHPNDFEPAEWNATLGRDHEAIAILKKRFVEHDEQLLDIVMNPLYARLANDPEAQPMLSKIRNLGNSSEGEAP